MSPANRERLTALLAGFDEVGLEALANKGLLRRARKDLESTTLSHEEKENAFSVTGPDWTVTMPPEGPAKATDTTKASGVTRQILMATLYLQKVLSAATAPSKPVEDLTPLLLAITLADLEKWSNKTTVRDALELLPNLGDARIEAGGETKITLVKQEIQVRFYSQEKPTAKKLWDAALATGPKSQAVFWRVVGILALHAANGIRHERQTAANAALAVDSPQSPSDILAAARLLFSEMLNTGLTHVSEYSCQRLFTLSLSCQAVGLPRLGRSIRSLSDEADRALRREVSADAEQFLTQLSIAEALTRAIQKAGAAIPLALAGQSRTEYAGAGDLDLTGIGAWPWQTPSGFEGITVLFWERTQRRFLTFGRSRPSTRAGQFTWANAYFGEAVWRGGPSVEQLARSSFQLRQVRVNPQGRLSGSSESSVELGEASALESLGWDSQSFTDWNALMSYAAAIYPIGLHLPHPLDSIVVLKPSGWGGRVFHEMEQALCWTLIDNGGRELTVKLPWCGVNENSIEFLEAVQPERDKLIAVIARIGFDGLGIELEPLSLISQGTPKGDRILCPGFDLNRIQSRHSSLLEKLLRQVRPGSHPHDARRRDR